MPQPYFDTNLTLTEHNHFRWAYNENDFSWRQHAEDLWSVRYGQPQRSSLNWKEENQIAAEKIYNAAAGQTLWLTLSGGIDSEVMVRSFLEAGIPFRLATLRFDQQLNQHDLSWAERFVKQNQISDWALVDLNIGSFLTSGQAFEYAMATQCTAPELLATMWLMDQLEGCVVLGSGECFLVREALSGYVPGKSPYTKNCPWYLKEKESVVAWYKYALWRKRVCVPGFFQYTPEQISSFFKSRTVEALTHNQIVGKLNSKSVKFSIYQDYYPDLEVRPKYTGYENLQGICFDFQCFLERYLPGCHQYFLTPTTTFEEQKEAHVHNTQTATL